MAKRLTFVNNGHHHMETDRQLQVISFPWGCRPGLVDGYIYITMAVNPISRDKMK